MAAQRNWVFVKHSKCTKRMTQSIKHETHTFVHPNEDLRSCLDFAGGVDFQRRMSARWHRLQFRNRQGDSLYIISAGLDVNSSW